jgi:hypothetical protein
MDTREVNYNSLTQDQKIEFIKAEIARKKAFFRGETPRNGLSAELTKQFSDLSMRLSPENLHEDGEASKARVMQKHKQIMKEWADLEKLAGRKVCESEFPY